MISDASRRAVADASKHLSDQLGDVLMRHAKIMQAGGMLPHEGAAAVMAAVEQMAFTAIGLVTLQAAPANRPIEVAAAIIKLASCLSKRSGSMLRDIDAVEQRGKS